MLKYVALYFPNILCHAFGIDKSKPVRGDQLDLLRAPYIMYYNIPEMMYIYCDLVQHQLVGDTKSQLLRIVRIPLGSESASVIFDKPHYVPVSRHYFDSIHIETRTVEGLSFPFSEGHITMKLHFRRVRV